MTDRRLLTILADVFVPDRGICGDVIGEQADAFVGVQVDDSDTAFAQPIDAAAEVDRLADDDRPDVELADQAAAVPAGSKRGDHDFVAIAALTAGFAEGVGFSVDGGIALLDAAVVSAAEDLAIARKQCGADGNAAFGEAEVGFLDGDLQQGGVHAAIVFEDCAHARSAPVEMMVIEG
jgi:hypothetical protein